jgi:hypothetical protein
MKSLLDFASLFSFVLRPRIRVATSMVGLACMLASVTACAGVKWLSGKAGAAKALPLTGFAAWAPTPPMGWNSWDCYGPTVTEAEVKANADYMAEHLKRHGWEYVVVDIRWQVANDKAHGYQKKPIYSYDPYGRFTPALNRFPSAADGKGFGPLADYVHVKGLKFGIHIMRGVPSLACKANMPIEGSTHRAGEIGDPKDTCPWLKGQMWGVDTAKPGGQDYYDSIMRLYASWGVDYIKVDDCSRPYHQAEIEALRKAIDKCGRPIVLSLSPGATPLWAAAHVARHANLWRIQDDFWDNWKALKISFTDCANWAPLRRPGCWPDADMLPLGRIGIRAERGNPRQTHFTPNEQRALMTLWSIFQSPLMMGGDLPSNDPATLALLTNDEVLAVNRHSTGGRQLFRDGDKIAWVADAPNGRDRYLALFNAGDDPAPATVSVELKALGFEGACRMRDLWAHRDLGKAKGTFSASIPRHGAMFYRLSPAR